jgi:ribonuclease HI
VWIHKWKKNGWKLTDGGIVKNKEDLVALDEALEGMCVKWVCRTKKHWY